MEKLNFNTSLNSPTGSPLNSSGGALDQALASNMVSSGKLGRRDFLTSSVATIGAGSAVGLFAAALPVQPVAANGTRATYVKKSVSPQNMNSVFEWTDVMLQATQELQLAPPEAGRLFAMAHLAGFCALNGIFGRYGDTQGIGQGPTDANPDAAYHTAIASVLSFGLSRSFDTELRFKLSRIPHSEAKARGVGWGLAVAEKIKYRRKHDGSAPSKVASYGGSYQKRSHPYAWERTTPVNTAATQINRSTNQNGLEPPLLPSWGGVTPFGVGNIYTYQADPFPNPQSEQFVQDYLKIKAFGGQTSAHRTRDQSEVAFFWEDGPGGITTAGRFLLIAAQLFQGKMSTYELARAMCFVSMAICDAGIAAWHSKYHYDILRPETAIRSRFSKYNNLDPRMQTKGNWKALLPNPSFPAYTSGHSTFGSAAMRVIWNILGTQHINFHLKPVNLPWWPKDAHRSYNNLWDVAEENGLSRLYGGVHWSFDHTEGMRTGQQIADDAFTRHFPRLY